MNQGQVRSAPPWKILIADDDQHVHAATKLALNGEGFRGRAFEFFHAYSGEETMQCLRQHPDIAVVFLDVIMETDNAGLEAARRIREEGFNLVRLIMRTGHPGQAPEREIIVDYDIHDYKEKSGLTFQKLMTSLISALRAYDDLVALERHRRGLLSVLESVSWFDFDDVQRYVAGMLLEFSDLARLQSERMLIATRSAGQDEIQVLASIGAWDGDERSEQALSAFPPAVLDLVRQSFAQGTNLESAAGSALFVSGHGVDLVTYVEGDEAFANADLVLLEVFLVKVCQALANHRTFLQVADERNALLRGMALAAERWDAGAAPGLEQLGRLAAAMAQRLETTLAFPEAIDAAFLRNIAGAAMLHDLGNLALPPDLLARPAEFSAAERSQMQGHVAAGLQLLAGSGLVGADRNGLLALAGEVIAGHHECFDGSGYPHGLAGEDIPLAGRLVAVADAYVAMISSRPHRSAMAAQEARAAIIADAGKRFDPLVVEAFRQVTESGV